ncbi:MAG: hypothetical protein K0Q51_431 [Rickettsiaceae bacterium]|jgi:hypothetical protein|nr:hypothetical protein [Rickettsiaceae bacterium]
MSNYLNARKYFHNATHYGKEALASGAQTAGSLFNIASATGLLGAGLWGGLNMFKGIAGNVVTARAAVGLFPQKAVTSSLPYKVVDLAYENLIKHPTASLAATEAGVIAYNNKPIKDMGNGIVGLAVNAFDTVSNSYNALAEGTKGVSYLGLEAMGYNFAVDEANVYGIEPIKSEDVTVLKIPQLRIEEGVDYSDPMIKKHVNNIDAENAMLSGWENMSHENPLQHDIVDVYSDEKYFMNAFNSLKGKAYANNSSELLNVIPASSIDNSEFNDFEELDTMGSEWVSLDQLD